MIELTTPISEDQIRQLRVGDSVALNGIVVTGRDAAHKYIVEEYVKTGGQVAPAERALHDRLRELLAGSVIYHCGPVVRRDEEGRWHFVAAGPTTSAREEPYQAQVLAYFGARGVIGKGGMGPQTLAACQEVGACYFHAIGGAATLIAKRCREVLEVHKLEEFGSPEAFWVLRVEGFPAVVTMDSHGASIHAEVADRSRAVRDQLAW
jgi:fumarate hydratase class I